MSASVTWIRPLDRRMQRLFDWGDVWVNREHIERATKENEKDELIKCFPALATCIELGDVGQIPLLASGVQTEGSLLCLENAPRGADENGERGWTRLQHELKSSHVFGEPGKHWECSICNQVGAAKCACGAQRCHRHQAIAVAPKHRTVWKQSEFAPGPFYVLDPKWMRNELKVEFMADELDPGASLEEFAAVYMLFFADKMGASRQRLACLELYHIFNPAFKQTKECELPPVQLQEFQRVFDQNAPPRCRWCNSQILPKLEQLFYCNQACADAANPPEKCKKCQGEDFSLVQTTGHCKGRVNGMSRCKGCGHTEYCALVTGTSWGSKRKTLPTAQHWTKRRRA